MECEKGIPGRVAEQQPTGVLQRCGSHTSTCMVGRGIITPEQSLREQLCYFLLPQLSKPRMIEIIAIKTISDVSKGKKIELEKGI